MAIAITMSRDLCAIAPTIYLQKAIALNPNIPEFMILRGVANLFRGRLFLAWQDLSLLQQDNNKHI